MSLRERFEPGRLFVLLAIVYLAVTAAMAVEGWWFGAGMHPPDYGLSKLATVVVVLAFCISIVSRSFPSAVRAKAKPPSDPLGGPS